MSGLRIVQSVFEQLKSMLLEDLRVETCAVGFATRGGPADTWVVQDAEPVPVTAYERRDQISAALRPAFVVDVANRARREGLNVIFFHTHPFEDGAPRFSPTDDAGERDLADYLERRAPGDHLSVVLGPTGVRARRLGQAVEVPAWSVGETLTLLTEETAENLGDEQFNRQVLAFGAAGQRRIANFRYGIVGAGGTGSLTVQQLAYLGGRDFIVIDPDCVEKTNLNRLVGANAEDVGKPKVEIAERLIKFARPEAQVRTIKGDVIDNDVALQLAGLDFIFLCTDSHASRAVVSQIAYQYLVPVIDMGVSITVKDGQVTHVTGRVQLLAPSQPCLTCLNVLDAGQIRREMMTPEQRRADPYCEGAHIPQPSVISLNASAASLAVTMFLGVAIEAPLTARFQRYDGIKGVVRLNSGGAAERCIVCSPRGALAKGPGWKLPTRTAIGPEDEN